MEVEGGVDSDGELCWADWNDDVIVGGADPAGKVLLFTMRP